MLKTERLQKENQRMVHKNQDSGQLQVFYLSKYNTIHFSIDAVYIWNVPQQSRTDKAHRSTRKHVNTQRIAENVNEQANQSRNKNLFVSSNRDRQIEQNKNINVWMTKTTDVEVINQKHL